MTVRWRRGVRIPDQARDGLGLRPGERILAAAQDARGQWFAATEQALVSAGRRVPWVDVSHAQWLPDESVLLVDPVPGTFDRLRVALPEPGRLPEAVHERVMASIVVSRRVPVSPGTSVRVVGRDDGSGGMVWQVLPEAGVDPADPEVRRATDAMVTQLRGEIGR